MSFDQQMQSRRPPEQLADAFGAELTRRRPRPDPLDVDAPGDPLILTTGRRLDRLALFAAAIGARSALEPDFGDALDWLTQPRRVFAGRCAVDAVQEHAGLRLGLAMSEWLLLDDADADDVRDLVDGRRADAGPALDGSARRPEPRLFTCMVDGIVADRRLRAFGALVATAADEVRAELVQRHGGRVAGMAIVRDSFDRGGGVEADLVSDATARVLSLAAEDPLSACACGFDVWIEQWTAA